MAIIVGRKNLKNEWWTNEVRAAGVRRINYDVSEKLFWKEVDKVIGGKLQ